MTEKNKSNDKKPIFWIMAAGILLLAVVGIVCLAKVLKNQGEDPGKGEENPAVTAEGEGRKSDADGQGPDGAGNGAGPGAAFGERTQTINADLDGDGTPETVSIKDEPSGKTTVQANLQGASVPEITLQSVELISTQAKAADVDEDGKEEVILLQSSPLGSTYNWPGKLTLLRLQDGKWEPLSDRLTYGSNPKVQYEEAYPKSFSEGAFISVKVEKVLGTVEVRFTRPIFATDGQERFVCLDCHYESVDGGRWVVDRINNIQPPLGTGISNLSFEITVGNRPEAKDMGVKPDETLFSKFPDEFLFASGAGGWQTTLSLKADGSFTGKYLDVNMSADDNYDADHSICEFQGKCGFPLKLNPYAYVCRVEEISYPEPGETYVKDRIRYMTTEPYGLDNADELIIYLPGCPVSELPCEVVFWIRGSADWTWNAKEPDALPFFVIYNIDGGEAFSSPTLPE